MPNVPRLRRIILDSEDDTQVAELDTGYLQDDDTVRMPDLWTSCGCLRVIRFLSDVTLLRRRRLDELFPEGMAYRPRGPLMGVRRLEGFCFLPNITCVCLPVAPGVSRE